MNTGDAMTSSELVQFYGAVLVVALVAAFIVWRVVRRRGQERREQEARQEAAGGVPSLAPGEFTRARIIFFLALILLAVMIYVWTVG